MFTQNIREIINEDINELKSNKDKNQKVKSTFLTASNYQIERLVRSGDALVNDEITTYLHQMTDVILRDNKELRKQLKFFTLKSTVVNAYSFDKGYIFIDLGLIAQVESEAQLAYIMCHEIAHYTKQHQINSYVVNDQIERNNYEGGEEEKYSDKCQYSREYESEADLEGFKMFERTLYNLKQAEKSFEMLQYSHLPFELVEVKKTFFERPNYVLPSRYFLKEVSPIRDNSYEDDSKHTHPNTSKRRAAIAAIAADRENIKRTDAIVGKERFEYIRNISRMELCRLYLKNRDYPNALYASYILSMQFPNNQYVHEVLSKSLYGLALYANQEVRYNDDSSLGNGIPSYSDIESFPQQIYHLIEKMPANEWAVLSLNQVFRLHKKFPASKPIQDVSDSLFKLLGRTEWRATDFDGFIKKSNEVPIETKSLHDTLTLTGSKTDVIKKLQLEQNTSSEDTVYYRNVFADLFANDSEFQSKFPKSSNPYDGTRNFLGDNTYSRGGRNKKIRLGSVDTLILLEPFYIEIDLRSKQVVKYVSSDEKQESYLASIERMAGKLDLQLVKLDPGYLTAEDVEKMNDFSILNDWFDERLDSDAGYNLILNTDEIKEVIARYGTSFALKTGIATLRTQNGKKRSIFYALLFDLNTNKLVYRKEQILKSKDRRDLVHAKTYQMLFELKHPKK